MTSPWDLPESMRVRYLERRRSDLVVLREAVLKRDREPLIKIGHQLRGNAVTFGFPQLDAIGERLEASGHAEDFASAAQIVEEIDHYLTCGRDVENRQ